MKPILPGLVMVLLATLLATLPARSDPPEPRTLAEVRADLAALDPYAADFEARIDGLLAEERALADTVTRVAVRR